MKQHLPLLLVVLECAWLAHLLRPHFTTEISSENDLLLHRYAINHLSKHFQQLNPFDFNLPLNGGFPLFSHYQHVAHVLVSTLRYLYHEHLPETVQLYIFGGLEPSADTTCFVSF